MYVRCINDWYERFAIYLTLICVSVLVSAVYICQMLFQFPKDLRVLRRSRVLQNVWLQQQQLQLL
jgi:hypothetical protein